MSENLDETLGGEGQEQAPEEGEGLSLDEGDLEALTGGGDEPADESEAAGAEEGGGGESLDLDADLEAMMGEGGEAGEGEAAGAEEGSGGESLDLDADLEAMMGEGGEETAGQDPAGGAPSPAPAPAGQGDGLDISKSTLSQREAINLDFLLDVKLNVTFEVGRSQMMISDLLTLGQGSVVELHRLVGEELDLLVNGRLIAKGEVVVVNEKFGCRITEIVTPQERVKHMARF